MVLGCNLWCPIHIFPHLLSLFPSTQWHSQGGGGTGAMAPPKLLVNVFLLQWIDVVSSLNRKCQKISLNWGNLIDLYLQLPGNKFCHYPPPPSERGPLMEITENYRVRSAGWPPPKEKCWLRCCFYSALQQVLSFSCCCIWILILSWTGCLVSAMSLVWGKHELNCFCSCSVATCYNMFLCQDHRSVGCRCQVALHWWLHARYTTFMMWVSPLCADVPISGNWINNM